MSNVASRELTEEQLAAYARDGFLVLRGVFAADEIALLAAEADRLLEQKTLIQTSNLRCRWQDHIETGECLFECFDPVVDISRPCAAIAQDERILEPLSLIYGEPAFLFKDKLIYKPPGAKGYGLHQDYIAWPNFPRSFTTVLVAIDEADADNGATEVFAGYHQQGCLSPEDGEYHELSTELVSSERGTKLSLEPGDVAVFGCLTPHRSAPNRSPRRRRQLYLSYNAASDGGERRTRHYQEFHAWLREKYAQYGKTETFFQ